MKKILILSISVVIISILSACGGSGGGSTGSSVVSSNKSTDPVIPVDPNKPTDPVVPVDPNKPTDPNVLANFFIEMEAITVDTTNGHNVSIRHDNKDIDFVYTGDLPIDTIDLYKKSDADLQAYLSPKIIAFEKNIAEIDNNGGSISLIDGAYIKYKNYYSFIWALGSYDSPKDYTEFLISGDEEQLFILTEEACKNLVEAGVTIRSKSYSLKNHILIMHKTCGVEYITTPDKTMYIDSLKPNKSVFYAADTPDGYGKAFRYNIIEDTDTLEWHSIHETSEVSTDESAKYQYQYAEDTAIILDDIGDFNSRLMWVPTTKLSSIRWNPPTDDLYYKGSNSIQISYTAGLPKEGVDDTPNLLDFTNEANLKLQLGSYLKEFLSNVAEIKKNGGSVYKIGGYGEEVDPHHGDIIHYDASLYLALLERVEATTKLSLGMVSLHKNRLRVVAENICYEMNQGAIEIRMLLHDDFNIVLMHESCNMAVTQVWNNKVFGEIQYEYSEYLGHVNNKVYKYSVSDTGEITFGDSLTK